MLNILILILWLIILLVLHIMLVQFLRMKQLLTTLVHEVHVGRNAKEHFKNVPGLNIEENQEVDQMESEMYNYLTKNTNERLSFLPDVIVDSNNFDKPVNDSEYASRFATF